MTGESPNLLKPGDSLGPYRIDSLLGKGGMGEVYRGTDTRLGRSVAIKISRREFSDRFEREAKAISSLNHPHVCTLYDVGPNYLVMEFVEGDTLAHFIKQGPLPLEAVLQYAIQIAGALSAAHANGVIHRDLKPGNIILTKTGVKVLDFGLAKLGPSKFSASGSSETMTMTEPMTEPGSIVGTVQYMSPEQAEGKDTDERSDIFSFGAVLYEMLTGRRAFDGETKTAILAAILKDQPAPIQQFQPMAPRSLDRVVRKCLEKKPADRWHSAHDLTQTLELIDLGGPAGATALVSAAASVSGTSGIQAAPQRSRRKWLWSAVAMAAVIALAIVGWDWWRANHFTDLPAIRQDVDLGSDIALANPIAFVTNVVISPDGTRIAYVARPASGGVVRLYTRRLDQPMPVELPGCVATSVRPADNVKES
jgi:serine/threonine protein kinase